MWWKISENKFQFLGNNKYIDMNVKYLDNLV